MPTYEYKCGKCKRRHEALQSITAKPLTKCPRCAGRLKRLISSGSGFLFKGSGFYITDYRSKSYNEAKKKDQPAPAGGSSSSSSSSSSTSSTSASPKTPPSRASGGAQT